MGQGEAYRILDLEGNLHCHMVQGHHSHTRKLGFMPSNLHQLLLKTTIFKFLLLVSFCCNNTIFGFRFCHLEHFFTLENVIALLEAQGFKKRQRDISKPINC